MKYIATCIKTVNVYQKAVRVSFWLFYGLCFLFGNFVRWEPQCSY